MARVRTYTLTSDPQQVVNNDGSSLRTYVVANVDAADECELLGTVDGDPQALGEGIPILAGDAPALDVAPGDVLYAAADTSVEVRVLELRAA
jgi:hypothetical protein